MVLEKRQDLLSEWVALNWISKSLFDVMAILSSGQKSMDQSLTLQVMTSEYLEQRKRN